MYRTDEKNYIRNTYPVLKFVLFIALLILAVGMFTACGQKGDPEHETADGISEEDLDNEDSNDEDIIADGDADKDTEEDTDGGSETDAADERLISYEELQEIFGENCICIYDHIYEVELSQYDGEVLFVPMQYTEEYPEFTMFIVQEGEVLRRICMYVRNEAKVKHFNSLDEVAFEDVNGDGCTDIVIIATFNGKSEASVFYGFETGSFIREYYLSDNVTSEIEQMTTAAVIDYIAGEKSNGEYADYREAYLEICRMYRLEHMYIGQETDWDVGYDLIYVDDDDIPELAAGRDGYYVSLYTFHDGTVYCLMDDWGYGAFGNTGYMYCPGMNSLKNYDQDGAGAIMNTTYMTINDQYSIEVTTRIVSYIFDDVNGNGVVDEDEEESVGRYGNWRVDYIDDEVVDVDYSLFDVGKYEYISTNMSYEELLSNLN